MIQFESLARRSRIAAAITLSGFAVIAIAYVLGFVQVRKSEQDLKILKAQIRSEQNQLSQIQPEVKNLKQSQTDLLQVFGRVISGSQIAILSRRVQWQAVQDTIIRMPPGARKQAALAAILLAWKNVPFVLGAHNVGSGYDSPSFISDVLSDVGISVKRQPKELLSDALMRSFKRTQEPKAGDLVFYKGQTGSFGLILLTDGKDDAIGVGTLQAVSPLQIMRLDEVNTPYFPLIGFFHVTYPDEIAPPVPH